MPVTTDLDAETSKPRPDLENAVLGTLSDLGSVGPPQEKRVGLQVLVGFLLVFSLYCASPNADSGDGYLSLPSAHSLLYEGNLDLNEFSDTPWYDRHYGVSTVDDRTLNYFPWLSAVFSMPAIAAWDAASSAGVVPNSSALIAEGSVGPIQVFAGSLPAATAAVALGLLTRRLFSLLSDGSDRRVLPGVLGDWSLTSWILVFGLGTSLWSVASRSMGQHAPSVLLAAGAMLTLAHLLGNAPMRPSRAGALSEDARIDHPDRGLHQRVRGPASETLPCHMGRLTYSSAFSLGALLALAYWARPTNAILVPVALGMVAFRRRTLLAPIVVGLVATHLAVIVANLALIGRAVPPYFSASRIGWHDEYLEAAAANLISPGRGLIVFSPFLIGALLLVLPSRRSILSGDFSAYAIACAAGTAAYLLAVSGYKQAWWAGASYGPRFMIETIVLIGPVALIGFFGPSPATTTRQTVRHIAGGTLILVSAVFHMGGAAIPAVQCWYDGRYDDDPPGVWVWSDPLFFAGPDALIGSGLKPAMSEPCEL